MPEPRWITKAGLLILHEDHPRARRLAWNAAYAFGIVLAMNLFFERNGWQLVARKANATLTMLRLAAG